MSFHMSSWKDTKADLYIKYSEVGEIVSWRFKFTQAFGCPHPCDSHWDALGRQNSKYKNHGDSADISLTVSLSQSRLCPVLLEADSQKFYIYVEWRTPEGVHSSVCIVPPFCFYHSKKKTHCQRVFHYTRRSSPWTPFLYYCIQKLVVSLSSSW